jgi:hypothetical protein
MPIFKVGCFEGTGNPKGNYEDVEAQTELEAAEIKCGEPLSEGGLPVHLRAVVVSGPPSPGNTSFYKKEEPEKSKEE